MESKGTEDKHTSMEDMLVIARTKFFRALDSIFGTPNIWVIYVAFVGVVFSAIIASLILTPDVLYYKQVAEIGIPGWDVGWPYPPLAGLIALPLRLIPEENAIIFWVWAVSMVFAGLSTWLIAKTKDAPYKVGAIVFFWFAISILSTSYSQRLEPFVVFLVLAGLLELRKGSLVRSGIIFGLAGLVKGWPIAFSAVTASFKLWRSVLSSVIVWATVAFAALLLGGSQVFYWVSGVTRGAQLESFKALFGLWLKAMGAPTYKVYYSNTTLSLEIAGPLITFVGLLIMSAVVGTLVGFFWAYRDILWDTSKGLLSDARLAFFGAVTTGLLIALPVLSPQYIAWLIPVLIVGLLEGKYRLESFLWLMVCGLTTLIFPVFYTDLYEGKLFPIFLLTVRAALIVTIFIVFLKKLTIIAEQEETPEVPFDKDAKEILPEVSVSDPTLKDSV